MDERGGATGVEMALLWTALIGMFLAVVQVGMLFYAGRLALGAAQVGAQTGRAYGADTVAAARRETESFLARSAGTSLRDVAVDVSIEGAGLLRVRVDGTALSLVPGVALHVSKESVGGLERVTR